MMLILNGQNRVVQYLGVFKRGVGGIWFLVYINKYDFSAICSTQVQLYVINGIRPSCHAY